MTEYEKLQRVYGDALEEKLTSAGRMVAAIDQKTPGLKNLLRSKGLIFVHHPCRHIPHSFTVLRNTR